MFLPPDSLAVERIGIFIGANEGMSGDPKLKYAVNDAQKMRDVLVYFGGFSAAESPLLANPDSNRIAAAIDKVKQRAKRQSDRETLLVIYYSGHADSYGLKVNNTRMSFKTLKSLIESTGTKFRIVILDSCQSGIITRTKGVKKGSAFHIKMDQRTSASGQVLIASSNDDEFSQESDDLGGSFFTHHFVSGLRGNADNSGDRNITLGEAYSYAYHQTIRQTAETRVGTQHPVFRMDIAGQGDIVLTQVSKGRTALVFPRPVQGDFLVWDKRNEMVIGEIALDGKDNRAMAVKPGHYVVKRRMDDHVQLGEIAVGNGEQKVVDVSGLKRVAFLDDYTVKSGGYQLPFSLGASVGYQSYYNSKAAQDVLSPGIFGGFFGVLERFPFSFWNIGVDFAFSTQTTKFPIENYEISTRLTQYQFGVILPFVWRASGWKFFAGPRLGGAVIIRQPIGEMIDYASRQSGISFSPGAEVGLGYTFLGKLNLDGRFQSSYASFGIDGDNKNLFSYLGMLSLGWIFDVTFDEV